MKNLEEDLSQLFENNFGGYVNNSCLCYDDIDHVRNKVMTKEQFAEIVSKFIDNRYCCPAGTEE